MILIPRGLDARFAPSSMYPHRGRVLVSDNNVSHWYENLMRLALGRCERPRATENLLPLVAQLDSTTTSFHREKV